jgi:translocation and assembly module TamB
MRVLVRRLIKIVLGILLLALLLLAWVIYTNAGTKAALRFAPSALKIETLEGSLGRPLLVKNLSFDNAATSVKLAKGNLRLSLLPLLRGKLVIDQLELDGLRLKLISADPKASSANGSAAEPPNIDLSNVQLRDVQVARDKELLLEVQSASAKRIQFANQALQLDGLSVQEKRGSLSAQGILSLASGSQSDLQLRVQLAQVAGQPQAAMSGQVKGDLKAMDANLVLSLDEQAQVSPDKRHDRNAAHFQGKLSDLQTDPKWEGVVAVSALDPAVLGIASPINKLQLELRGSGSATSINISGPIQINEASYSVKTLDLNWKEANKIVIKKFELGLPNSGQFELAGNWPRSLAEQATRQITQIEALQGQLNAKWTSLSLPEEFGWPKGLLSRDGALKISGNTEAFAVNVDAALKQVAPGQAFDGALRSQFNISQKTIALQSLEFTSTDGARLSANGELQLPGSRLDSKNANDRQSQLAQSAVDNQQSQVARSAVDNQQSQVAQSAVDIKESQVARSAVDIKESALSWKLTLNASDLNPAMIAKDYPGMLQVSALSAGELVNGLPKASVKIESLSGQLKGQAISGSGDLRFESSFQPTGDLRLQWGRNQADFQALASNDLQMNLDLHELSLLQPGATGSVQGSVNLSQLGQQTVVTAALSAQLLKIGDVLAEKLSFSAKIPADQNAPLVLKLDAQNIQSGANAIDDLQLEMDGTKAKHRLTLRALSSGLQVALAADGGLDTQQEWSGVLNALELAASAQLSRKISLRDPVALNVSAQTLRWSNACFIGDGVDLCASANLKDGSGAASVDLTELNLERVQQTFAVKSLPVNIRGILQGRAKADLLAFSPSQLQADFSARAGQNLIVTVPRTDDDDVQLIFDEFSINTNIDAARQSLINATMKLRDAGTIQLSNLQFQGETLSAQIDLDLQSLQAFNGLSEAIVNPGGQVSGRLLLSGARAAPSISGALKLAKLALELPAAGLKLNQGEISLDSDGSKLNVLGSIQSGEGKLNIAGWLAPFAASKAELKLSGENVLVADMPSVRVVASPNLTIVHEPTQVKVKGTVTVPSANVQLDRFESSVVRSDDVLIIDDAPGAPGTPVRADVAIALGENVKLRGFGLNGALTGRLKIRERPNKPGTARGEIEVKGTYKAYGQDLQIERGKLLYSSTALDDPGLDIRAFRKIEKEKAGVQVRGSALRPELTVWSDPVMEQSDIVSMIVTGQRFKNASGAQKEMVANAGGNLLAQGIGKRVGLELGVETLSDIGGPAFTAGKYLSPALYVGYGQGLFNPQTLFILRYKLFDNYELEGLSGREQKIGVNYRREK